MKICILDAKTLGEDMDLSVFEKFGELSIYPTTKADEVAGRIVDQEIVITNKVLLNEQNLKHAKKLKLICVAATGTNNIDLTYTREMNISVRNVAGYSSDSVAQHTFAMLFYLLENMSYYNFYVKSFEYAKSDIFTHLNLPFRELKGKRWGVIGFGEIGRRVALIAEAFGCSVAYYSTSGKNNQPGYNRLELDELLRTSDIVSIHAPLNESTRNLIHYEKLLMMKKNSILLNLGRGTIVNEVDLARALEEDLIAGAALDVLENEPIKETNPLLKLNNPQKLLITPHIAWASVEARTRLLEEIVKNIEAFTEGKERNNVN